MRMPYPILFNIMLGGLLLVLGVNFYSWLQQHQQTLRTEKNISLMQMRHYLIQYAQQYQRLPCPDQTGDGHADFNLTAPTQTVAHTVEVKNPSQHSNLTQHNNGLTCTHTLGFLPDYSLGHNGVRNLSGQRFIYALAPNGHNLTPSQNLIINGQRIALALIISSETEIKLTKLQNAAWQNFSSLGNLDNNDQFTWITAADLHLRQTYPPKFSR